MSTIEDKILNGPTTHYCEAGDDDVRSGEDVDENHTQNERNDASSLFTRPNDGDGNLGNSRFKGSSINTGPKGVIEDHRKLSDPRARRRQNGAASSDDIEAEFQELMNDDSILKAYISKRISEAMTSNIPTFGQIQPLSTGAELLDAIDKENPNVLVVVHLYTKYSRSCSRLNKCLSEIAKEKVKTKFVTLDASVTGLSNNFKENGVPALLAYKGGDLVKSIVQLDDLLDKDFDSTQVKELLIDNGLIS